MSDNNKNNKTKREVIRIGSHLSELVTVFDSAGNLIHKVVRPLMIEFYIRDVVQVIVGATILAVPVAFTEEVWELGATMPNWNVFYLWGLSIVFICLLVYHNFYQNHIRTHWGEFLKRVLSIYILSLLVAGTIMFIIGQASIDIGWVISLKRMIIVAFPASMSAAVADMIK
jgi:uncharacterized membrane protein